MLLCGCVFLHLAIEGLTVKGKRLIPCYNQPLTLNCLPLTFIHVVENVRTPAFSAQLREG